VTREALAEAQENNDELRTLLVSTTALHLERILISGTSIEFYYDTSSGEPHPYVPYTLRHQVSQIPVLPQPPRE